MYVAPARWSKRLVVAGLLGPWSLRGVFGHHVGTAIRLLVVRGPQLVVEVQGAGWGGWLLWVGAFKAYLELDSRS